MVKKCYKCGKTISMPNFLSDHVCPGCFDMIINHQKQTTLDDIFDIQPEEIKENEN